MKEIVNIAFKGYKVFPKNRYTYMGDISRVNVVIGKNNCGKTSLLDILGLIYDANSSVRAGIDVDEVIFDIPLDDIAAQRVFSTHSGLGRWTLSSLKDYFKEKLFTMKLTGNKRVDFLNGNEFKELGSQVNGITNYLAERRTSYRFRKITAERNISPEIETIIGLESDGQGATNLIRVFINDGNYDESIIENNLLDALNSM